MYNDDTKLFALFDKLGIQHHTDHHRPFFTAADRDADQAKSWAFPVKNFFTYDKKKNFYLITTHLDLPPIDFKALGKQISAKGNLSFAGEDYLKQMLGVLPGSVTPYAVFHDTERVIRVILDENIQQSDTISAHPMRNDMTTTIAVSDLKNLYKETGHVLEWVSIPVKS